MPIGVSLCLINASISLKLYLKETSLFGDGRFCNSMQYASCISHTEIGF